MDTTRVERPAPYPVDRDGEDHWTWRPEWVAERACTFWYLTIPRDAVRLGAYADTLAATPWLDVASPQGWHLTLTEIGYADERHPDLLADVAAAVDAAVRGRGPVLLHLGPVVRFRTAIALAAGPDDVLRELQTAVRGATRQVLGADRPIVHPLRFRPHVSLAYLNRDVSAAEAHALVDPAPDVDRSVEVDRLTLAAVTRQDRHYRWRVADEVRLRG